MQVAHRRRLRAGPEGNRPIERGVDAEERRPPLVTPELARRLRPDDRVAEQIEPEVARIGVGRDHAVDPDALAVGQTNGDGSPVLDHDGGDLGVGSDRPATRPQHLRERFADAMHAAPDEAAADVLNRRHEHPREVAAERIVGGEPGVQPGRREEESHLRALEGLVDPVACGLHEEPIAVRAVGRAELLGETLGPAVHGAHDGGLGGREARVERPPRVGVAPREPGDAGRRGLDVPADHEGAAVGKDLCPVRVRRDQLEPVLGEPELVRRGRELGDEVAARVNVGEMARRGDLLGDRHSPDGRVALEHDDAEPGLREIAGARQAVVSRADDDRVVRGHGADG